MEPSNKSTQTCTQTQNTGGENITSLAEVNEKNNTRGVSISHAFRDISILTFDLDPRSKVTTPNESPYMISYMSTIQLESLTLMIFEIIEEKCLFDLSRSSEVKGQGRTTMKN